MDLDSTTPSNEALRASDAPPSILAQPLADLSGVEHGFFGRRGGVSTGLYARLNTGPGSDDAPEAVVENRRRIAGAFGLGPERLLTLHQVHSPTAVIVEAPWSGKAPEADALITATPGLALSVLTADCAPVLFADPDAQVIAAAHAGWKGAFSGVLEATVAAMETLGANTQRIHAAIGPCISQASYEVGPEFAARFVEDAPANAAFFKPGQGDRVHFDLKGYVGARLEAAGVGAVWTSPACTCADEADYFSNRRRTHRGEPDYGRNLSAILLRENSA